VQLQNTEKYIRKQIEA